VVAVQLGMAGEKADDDGAPPGSRAKEPEVPLLESRTAAADGSPQAYLCRGMVCDLPLGSAEELVQRLDAMLKAAG
jgi:uncharacterized protein YyaL (SSP411 family)